MQILLTVDEMNLDGAFAFCGALFALLVLVLASQDAAAAGGAPLVDVLLSDAFWSNWRLEVGFFLVRLVYALSALPYLLFHLPGIRTLLSHTFATGYTEDGACVPCDMVGLSAFAKWLDGTIRRPEVLDQLTATELATLQRLLADARSCLAARPSKGALDRKHKSLEQQLGALILPSHALFPTCFPERLLCLEYERAASEARAAKRRAILSSHPKKAATWDEHQSARYGVEWQKDAESDECALCARRFTFFHRRHHCRQCGRLVCAGCSRARRLPAKGADVPKRACDRCVQAGDDAPPAAEGETAAADQPEVQAEQAATD